MQHPRGTGLVHAIPELIAFLLLRYHPLLESNWARELQIFIFPQ